MRLLRFSCKHLFSLGTVDINLEGRGLTLVTGYNEDDGGNNGAGKSSLANKGILWTLFGETAGGIKADSVGNRHTKKGCYGEISFADSAGTVFTVRRGRPALLTLRRASVDVSAKTAKDTQDQIDKALGIDFKTFIQTSFFGQGRSLSYASLTPKDQKAVLEQILPMEEVDRWATYAEQKYKMVSLQALALERNARHEQVRLDTMVDEHKRMESASLGYEANRQNFILQLTDKFTEIERKFKAEEENINTLRKQVNYEIEQDIENAVKKHSDIKTALGQTYATERQASEAFSYWSNRYQSLKNEQDEITKGKACPVCLREYDSSTTEAVTKRLHTHEGLMEEAAQNIKTAKDAYAYWDKEVGEIEQQDRDSDRSIRLMIEDKRRKDSLTGMIANFECRKESAVVAVRDEIRRAQETENPHFDQLKGMAERITWQTEGAARLQNEFEKAQVEALHLEYWRNVYAKELKLKLFEEACPFLDSRTDHHLKRLGNAQIHVEFSTIKRLASGATKEEFSVNVWSETGGYGFDALSGGEQQMVSFAIGLGLADLAARISGGRSSFLILDEPFAELDARNSEAIVSYLSAEVEGGRDTIFLISNDESLKGMVQKRIHVVKRNGISEVCDGV